MVSVRTGCAPPGKRSRTAVRARAATWPPCAPSQDHQAGSTRVSVAVARQLRLLSEMERTDSVRRVFRVPWRDVERELPVYGDYVRRQMALLGESHPFIRTEYELEELDGGGAVGSGANCAGGVSGGGASSDGGARLSTCSTGTGGCEPGALFRSIV